MSGRIFVDTNVLVYCFDRSAPDKMNTAHALVNNLWDNENGVLSLQVLKEFFVTVTSKLAVRMDPQSAKSAVFDLMSWTLVYEDRRSMEKAFEIAENFRLSFWDANILSAALLSNCEALYTEDLQHGQSIDGLRIVNPFL